MKTDKQLLALSKVDLVKEYRKLEEAKSQSPELTLEQLKEAAAKYNLIIKTKTDYSF